MARRAFGSIRRLPSKRYQASYLGPDKRRHTGWSTYLAKGDAEGWLNDEERLIDQGSWTPPARRRPVAEFNPLTLKEYAEANLKRRATRAKRPIRPTTVDLYERLMRLSITPRLGNVPLADLTPQIIARWHDELPATSPTQNANAYMLLKSLLADAVDEDLIPKNPAKIKDAGKPKPAHKPVTLNVGELGVYVAAAERHTLPLLLAAWCALRSGEVRGLRRMDVKADGSAVRIEQAVSRVGRGKDRDWHFGDPKTDAGARWTAVPPHLQPALATWVEDHPGDPEGLLFPAEDGVSPIHEGVLRRAHKVAAAAVGHPEMTLHDLRKTGATLAGQGGATIKELMRFLGHTTPQVAMLYQVADDDRDKLRAKRMSELLTRPDQ